MVLTTTATRRQDLDDEIRSLINLTIQYPALSPGTQARIWENLITASRATTDESWDEAVYAELGKLNINVSGSPQYLYV